MEGMRTWPIRPFVPADGPETLQLFRDTIRRVNARDYDPMQIFAWAPDEIDLERWTQRFQTRYAIVAENGEQIVGFAELEDDGHLDRFYVHADFQGRGVGRYLLADIFRHARSRAMQVLSVEASITARPFFERFGFTTIAGQSVLCRGVALTNFRMRKIMESPISNISSS